MSMIDELNDSTYRRLNVRIHRELFEALRGFGKRNGKGIDEAVSHAIVLAIKPSGSEQELLDRFLFYLRMPDDKLSEFDRLTRMQTIKKLLALRIPPPSATRT